jgi:FMN reductase (NADPH)
MNQLIDFLRSHASLRQFTEQGISAENECTILNTAQQSPTSSNLQGYSIIAIRNSDTKARLAEMCGHQQHVIDCPLFLVFCADLFRLRRISERAGYPFYGEYTELFIVATVDTTLVAGRALMAAQALGMGGVMVGSIRNHISRVAEMLELPELVYPVMGMSLGYPAASPRIKPRMSLEGICFPEKYRPEKIDPAIDEYDTRLVEYGHLQSREVQPEKYPNFKGLYTWSEHTARRLANTSPTVLRPHMKHFLEDRGFMLQ